MWTYSGNPLMTDKDRENASTLEARFWSKVQKADSCWLWQGAKNEHGYGIIRRGRRGEGKIKAHRFSYQIAYGPIPDGAMVLHHCDNPSCVRPDHLYLGTQSDNVRDAHRRHRMKYDSLPRGEAHHKTKLTEAQVRDARYLYATKQMSLDQLASLYGVAKSTMWGILCRRYWRHVG